MSGQTFCCQEMAQQCERGVIRYDDRFDDYSILLSDNGEVAVLQRIWFCPWSGDRLPESLRDRWFDELEALGIDPMNDPIPEEYRSSSWRRGLR